MLRGRNFKNNDYPANFSWIKVPGATHTINILCGIGETVAKVIEAANKLTNLTLKSAILADPIKATLDKIDQMVFDNIAYYAEKYKFNATAIATQSQYSKSEMLATKKFADEQWGSKRFSTIVHSQGGFNQWNVMDSEIGNSLDGTVWVAPGPGRNDMAAKIIAEKGFANWFITSDLDRAAGDLGLISENWHNWINAAGGKSFLTLYKDTTVDNEHSIFGHVISNPAKWEATGNAAVPKMNIFEFLLSNGKGQPTVAPTDTFKRIEENPAPAPVPVPTPDPTPTPDPEVPTPDPIPEPPSVKKQIQRIVFSHSNAPFFMEIWYSTGDKDKVKVKLNRGVVNIPFKDGNILKIDTKDGNNVELYLP